jgi:hypothetical protein
MQPTPGRPWQSGVALSVVVVGLMLSATLSSAQDSGNLNPGVFPIHSTLLYFLIRPRWRRLGVS